MPTTIARLALCLAIATVDCTSGAAVGIVRR
jgi:hypothetical protein